MSLIPIEPALPDTPPSADPWPDIASQPDISNQAEPSPPNPDPHPAAPDTQPTVPGSAQDPARSESLTDFIDRLRFEHGSATPLLLPTRAAHQPGESIMMRLWSRMEADLEAQTDGKRVATYGEIHESLHHAARAEGITLPGAAQTALGSDDPGDYPPAAQSSQNPDATEAVNSGVANSATRLSRIISPPATQSRREAPVLARRILSRYVAQLRSQRSAPPQPASRNANMGGDRNVAPANPAASPGKPGKKSPGKKALPAFPTHDIGPAKSRAEWQALWDNYIRVRRAAGAGYDPTQDARVRKNFADDLKRITNEENGRFLETIRKAGRTAELFTPNYAPITEEEAGAIERRAGYSDQAMTQDSIIVHHPLIAARARLIRSQVEADTAKAYPGIRSWRNEADAFKHADLTVRLQREFGTQTAQMIEDGHESKYQLDGMPDSRGDRLQDITNNHNLRILAEIFPDMSPTELARMAIQAGYAQTRIYHITPPPPQKARP